MLARAPCAICSNHKLWQKATHGIVVANPGYKKTSTLFLTNVAFQVADMFGRPVGRKMHLVAILGSILLNKSKHQLAGPIPHTGAPFETAFNLCYLSGGSQPSWCCSPGGQCRWLRVERRTAPSGPGG